MIMNILVAKTVRRLDRLISYLTATEIKDYLMEVEEGMRKQVDDELDDLGGKLLLPEKPGEDNFRMETNILVKKFAESGLTLFQVYNWFTKNPKFRNEPMVKKVFDNILSSELQENKLDFDPQKVTIKIP